MFFWMLIPPTNGWFGIAFLDEILVSRFFAKPGLCRLVPVCGAPWGHKGLVSLSPRRFEKPAGPGHGAPGWGGSCFFFLDFRVTLKVGDVLRWRRPWRGAGLLSLFCKCCVFFGGVSGRGGWRGAITFFRLRFKDVAYYVGKSSSSNFQDTLDTS